MQLQPSIGPFSRTAKQVTRRSAGPQKQRTKCSGIDGAYGLLTHRFEGLITPEAIEMAEERQQDFFTSLMYFQQTQSLTLPLTTLPYPLNINWYLQKLEEHLTVTRPQNGLIYQRVRLIATQQTACCILVQECIETNDLAIYLPLKPIYGPSLVYNAPLRRLLQSVYAYCLNVLGFPIYTISGYMAYQYAMLEDHYLTNSPDDLGLSPSDQKELLRRIQKATKQGTIAFNRLANPIHLRKWKDRLEQFCPANAQQYTLKEQAHVLFDLYQQRPAITLQEYLSPPTEDEYDGYCIPLDAAVSFIWDYDPIFELIEENLQTDWGDALDQERMENSRFFDRPNPLPTNDLTHIHKVLSALDQIAYCLRKQS